MAAQHYLGVLRFLGLHTICAVMGWLASLAAYPLLIRLIYGQAVNNGDLAAVAVWLAISLFVAFTASFPFMNWLDEKPSSIWRAGIAVFAMSVVASGIVGAVWHMAPWSSEGAPMFLAFAVAISTFLAGHRLIVQRNWL